MRGNANRPTAYEERENSFRARESPTRIVPNRKDYKITAKRNDTRRVRPSNIQESRKEDNGSI